MLRLKIENSTINGSPAIFAAADGLHAVGGNTHCCHNVIVFIFTELVHYQSLVLIQLPKFQGTWTRGGTKSIDGFFWTATCTRGGSPLLHLLLRCKEAFSRWKTRAYQSPQGIRGLYMHWYRKRSSSNQTAATQEKKEATSRGVKHIHQNSRKQYNILLQINLLSWFLLMCTHAHQNTAFLSHRLCSWRTLVKPQTLWLWRSF